MAAAHAEHFSALGHGYFGTDIFSSVCIDFVVCITTYYGAGFNQ